MQYQGSARSIEFVTGGFRALSQNRGRQVVSPNLRKIDPTLFKQGTACHDAGTTTAAFFSFPGIFSESADSIQLLQSLTNLVLQLAHKLADSIFGIGWSQSLGSGGIGCRRSCHKNLGKFGNPVALALEGKMTRARFVRSGVSGSRTFP
jgi:hypothetical protein